MPGVRIYVVEGERGPKRGKDPYDCPHECIMQVDSIQIWVVVVDRIYGREASTDVRSVQQEAGPDMKFSVRLMIVHITSLQGQIWLTRDRLRGFSSRELESALAV
jgi:hypothetical protein